MQPGFQWPTAVGIAFCHIILQRNTNARCGRDFHKAIDTLEGVFNHIPLKYTIFNASSAKFFRQGWLVVAGVFQNSKVRNTDCNL